MPAVGDLYKGGLFVKEYADYYLIISSVEITSGYDSTDPDWNDAVSAVNSFSTSSGGITYSDWRLPTVTELEDIAEENGGNNWGDQPLAPSNGGNQLYYQFHVGRKYYWASDPGQFPFTRQAVWIQNQTVQFPSYFGTDSNVPESAGAQNWHYGEPIFVRAVRQNSKPVETSVQFGQDESQNEFQSLPRYPATRFITTMVAGNKGSGSSQPQSINFTSGLLGINVNPQLATTYFNGAPWQATGFNPAQTIPCMGSGAKDCSLAVRARQMWQLNKNDNSNTDPNPNFNNAGAFNTVQIGTLFSNEDDFTLGNVFRQSPGPFKMSDFHNAGHGGIIVNMISYPFSYGFVSGTSTRVSYRILHGLSMATGQIHLGPDTSKEEISGSASSHNTFNFYNTLINDGIQNNTLNTTFGLPSLSPGNEVLGFAPGEVYSNAIGSTFQLADYTTPTTNLNDFFENHSDFIGL